MSLISSTLKDDMQRYQKIDEKVVSSCLLQYKPVRVINFDKLRHKMLKRRSLVFFLQVFGTAILQKSLSCMTSC